MEMIAVMSGCLELQMMKEKLNVYVRMFNVHILNCHNDYHTIIYNDEQNKSVPPDLLTLTLMLSWFGREECLFILGGVYNAILSPVRYFYLKRTNGYRIISDIIIMSRNKIHYFVSNVMPRDRKECNINKCLFILQATAGGDNYGFQIYEQASNIIRNNRSNDSKKSTSESTSESMVGRV
mmetsp:Transcript_42916/g.52124  ORF Transcript_42916/g.52124 Transcript_42916/m.52124 type:complete len:180 (+) Transcript_42916:148-687(+)